MLSPPVISSSSQIYDVIIIGAGVAGLAAAQRINTSTTSRSCLVVEARSRAGGRVWTEKNIFSVPVDFGAHWIHTFWYNPLVKLALKHGVELYPNEYQRAGFYKGGKRVDRKIVKKARIRFNYVLTALSESNWSDNATIEEVTREELHKLNLSGTHDATIEQLVMAFMFHLVSDNSGLDLYDVNLNNWKKGEEDFDVDGGDQLPETGMWSLFEKEFKDILPKVKYNCVVSAIDYGSENVTVYSNLGKFTARHVIITVPFPVLKQNRIKFNPELPPEYKKAFSSFKTGFLNCITIQFAYTFWREDDEFLLYLPDELPYPPHPTTENNPDDFPYVLLFNTFHHTLPGLITAWTYGKQALAWEKNLSDDQQLQRAVRTLEKMFERTPAGAPDAGVPISGVPQSPVPPVVKYAVSRWASDEFALGSFAATDLNFESDMELLKVPLKEKVMLCGEALAEKYGTVHGAYRSGRDTAEKFLELLNRRKTSKL